MLRKFVEPDDIAATLENLYSNKQFRLEQAQKAYDNATQAAYKWDRIAAQWDDLLQRIRLDSPSVR
jgi:glycosyltransferase involved in cell wall biosynthesis